MARPLIEAGRLRTLSTQRMRAEFSHYLVYPPRSAERPGVPNFRRWLHEQARNYMTP